MLRTEAVSVITAQLTEHRQDPARDKNDNMRKNNNMLRTQNVPLR